MSKDLCSPYETTLPSRAINACSQRPSRGNLGAASGGVLVWLLLVMVLLLAAGMGFYWYKASTQNESLARRESQLSELEQSFALLQEDLEEARARTTEAEQRIQTFEARMGNVQQVREQVATLEAELTDMQNRNQALQAKLDQCAATSSSMDDKHDKLAQAQEELMAAMASMEAENQKLLERNKKLQAAMNELQTEKQQLADSKARLESDVQELKLRNEAMLMELGKLKPKQQQLKKQVSNLEDKAASAQGLRSELQDCASQLNSLQQKSGQKIEALDSRSDTLVQDLEQLTKRLETCKGRLASLQEGADAAKQQTSPQKQTQQQAKEQEKDLQAQQQAAQDAADKAAAQRDDCAELAEELDRLRSQDTAPDSQELQKLEDTLLQCRTKAEELEAKHRQEKQMADAYEAMIKDLKQEIQQKEVSLQRVKDRLEIKILGHILFDLGSTHITGQGRGVLEKIIPSLEKVDDRQIYVVGHTDDIGIAPDFTKLFPSNWELSAARAARVVRFITNHAELDPSRLAAVGVSYHQPEASNETPEGRAQNRRVEIVIGAPLLPQ